MAGIAEQLRQAVLQAAIQGKLTEQLPEDGNAKDLLAEIQAEKAKLIAEKKIKKEKALTEITNEEFEYELPDNWCWCCLQAILDVRDGTHDSPQYYSEGVPFVTSKNLVNGKIDFSNVKYISEEDAIKFNQRSKVEVNDILMAMIGSIGKPVLVDDDRVFAIKNMALVKHLPVSMPDMRYILILLNIAQTQMNRESSGGVQKFVSLDYIRKYRIPLPPLAEQHRLVARVDELMAKIDELEKVENELNALHKAFPGDMKAALLQAAMQGKLTEQLPEDGNAEDLLKSIETEKAKLIAEKKIKKQKASEPISEEDAPLQIPSNWSWAYIGDIFSHNAGKALNAKNQVGSKHKYITTSNVYWDHFELDNLKEMYYTDEEAEKYSVKKGDLLVLEGGDIGRSAIWNLDVSYCIQNHLHCLRPYLASSTNVKYYYYLMMLYKQIGAVNGKGIAIQGLSANALHSIAVPVAPLAEQQRIVEKLDKLLPLCDSLEEKL